jgi:hypothetical protein
LCCTTRLGWYLQKTKKLKPVMMMVPQPHTTRNKNNEYDPSIAMWWWRRAVRRVCVCTERGCYLCEPDPNPTAKHPLPRRCADCTHGDMLLCVQIRIDTFTLLCAISELVVLFLFVYGNIPRVIIATVTVFGALLHIKPPNIPSRSTVSARCRRFRLR